ncbi:fungal-specific transcription factor domain-containing protein [Penicillium chermesinum]|nr:fungal-specific transcription factor domain-containing protein [Penicillium chermesinum]
MGTSSGVSFAKLVLASIKHDIPLAGAESPERQRQHRPTPTEPSTIVTSLPPRHAADHIARAYFSYRTPHLPILEQKSVEIIFNRVYDQPLNCSRRVAEHDMFITYMVLAIGLFSMSTRGGSRPQQSEGCFNAALQRVDTLLSYSSGDLDTLTTLILIAQYLVLNPSRGNLWQLTGVILRLCVDTGLHWETETILAFPEALLNKRRRLYWAAYGLDRFLCINLGRPFGIAEQSMSTRLPDPYISEAADGYESGKLEVLHQRLANHIIKLYRLQSEIKHVLYHQIQGATVAYPRPNYNLWFRDIQSRLRAWHDEIPAAKQCDSECIYAQQAWWEASFSGTVLLLHRPNPLVANPSSESLKTCYDTACRCIRAIKTLQREGHITIVWESVHQLFMAGLTIIYCMWQSPQIRESTSVVDFATVSQDCAVALTALVEYFPEAKGCRDAFELVTSATLRWLGTKAEDNGLDCHGSILNHEIDLVRELMPFSTARWQIHDPGSIFPDEPFELANFLSEAAQYHRPWDLTSDFSLDDLMGDFSSIEGGFS